MNDNEKPEEEPGMYPTKMEALTKIFGYVLGSLFVLAFAILVFLGLAKLIQLAYDGFFSERVAPARIVPAEASVNLVLPAAPTTTTTTVPMVATATKPAVRISPPALLFANDCAEMDYYRTEAGLPEIFDKIGWRESNCRNEDGVRTWCCYGYWQNYIASHLDSQSAYRERIIADCGVTSYRDVNSDTPEDKKRQACVTFVVYSIERELGRSGLGPWHK